MLKKSWFFYPTIIVGFGVFIYSGAQASEEKEATVDIEIGSFRASDLNSTEFQSDDKNAIISPFTLQESMEMELYPDNFHHYASEIAMEPITPSNSWHFLFQPSIYIPFTIYGDARAGSLTGDFALDASQIRKSIKDDLNFAFFGRMKAWTPDYRLGLFADFDYLSLDSRASVTRTLPVSLGSIPVTLNAGVDSTLWSLSFGGAYRFYNSSQVNPEGVNTEFDLGSSVFDVFAGLNITGIDLGLDFNAPGLGSARFDGSKTVVSPIVGGRFRFNVHPQWAIVGGGSFSGFGINGLRQWNLSTGVDWLFSEKTSLGLGYRFGYTGYNSTLRTNTDFGIDVNQNGPYLNLSFRF
ncbi:hypothetical protein Cyast_2530 [Cyanobacterium stanieri PCC 7202]|uniref:Uncharacterized protein n=1 Tax=Cyanobacterium stanieri (strain ATCC 29140 / PCC 7202) TaxID=292563 RepID=K9YQT3_CYASC|nr:hypothetical protein Cyast_2530 [Cyanobacterium stanieri PCC 7202]